MFVVQPVRTATGTRTSIEPSVRTRAPDTSGTSVALAALMRTSIAFAAARAWTGREIETRDVHVTGVDSWTPSERLHNLQPKRHRLCIHIPKQIL